MLPDTSGNALWLTMWAPSPIHPSKTQADPTEHNVLFEQDNKEGYMYGFTKNYIKVKAPFNNELIKSSSNVFLNKVDSNLIMKAEIKELCIQQ